MRPNCNQTIVNCILPLMICVSVRQNPPGHPLLKPHCLRPKHFSNTLSIVPLQTMAKASFLYRGHNPGSSIFLQDGHTPHIMLLFFCIVDGPRPYHDVTDMYVTMVFRKMQCTHRLISQEKNQKKTLI